MKETKSNMTAAWGAVIIVIILFTAAAVMIGLRAGEKAVAGIKEAKVIINNTEKEEKEQTRNAINATKQETAQKEKNISFQTQEGKLFVEAYFGGDQLGNGQSWINTATGELQLESMKEGYSEASTARGREKMNNIEHTIKIVREGAGFYSQGSELYVHDNINQSVGLLKDEKGKTITVTEKEEITIFPSISEADKLYIQIRKYEKEVYLSDADTKIESTRAYLYDHNTKTTTATVPAVNKTQQTMGDIEQSFVYDSKYDRYVLYTYWEGGTVIEPTVTKNLKGEIVQELMSTDIQKNVRNMQVINGVLIGTDVSLENIWIMDLAQSNIKIEKTGIKYKSGALGEVASNMFYDAKTGTILVQEEKGEDQLYMNKSIILLKKNGELFEEVARYKKPEEYMSVESPIVTKNNIYAVLKKETADLELLTLDKETLQQKAIQEIDSGLFYLDLIKIQQ